VGYTADDFHHLLHKEFEPQLTDLDKQLQEAEAAIALLKSKKASLEHCIGSAVTTVAQGKSRIAHVEIIPAKEITKRCYSNAVL
jgi:hypothetical protein